jgi:hypothetical protein
MLNGNCGARGPPPKCRDTKRDHHEDGRAYECQRPDMLKAPGCHLVRILNLAIDIRLAAIAFLLSVVTGAEVPP